MKQNFITINGLRIAYFEKNPTEDKIIFFIHGNSCSSRVWQKQLQSELFNNYRLIAFDLPGHGKSSASKNPLDDYSPIGTAKLLSSVVNELADNGPYILVGFSYGTNVVAEMLAHSLKPAGIMLIGSCVIGIDHGLEKVFIPKASPSIFFYNEPDIKVVYASLSELLTSKEENDIQNLVEDYLTVCPHFKSSLFKTVEDGKISDEILLLQKSDVPVATIFGKNDDVVNIQYLDDRPFQLWKDQIYKVSGAGHWVNIDNPTLVNQLILVYANEMFKATHV